MEIHVNPNRGFTLIEALVALVILAITLSGLLAGLLASIDYKLRNLIRDEAKAIALECVENIRNTPYDNIPPNGSVSCNAQNPVPVAAPCTTVGTRISNGTPEIATRQIRNTSISYTLGWNISSSNNVKQVKINVCWNHQGRNHSHTVTMLIGRESQ